MVIDTSAIVAILLDEPDRKSFAERLESADRSVISAANFVEASIVLESRYGAAGVLALDALMSTARIEMLPVDAQHARVAREAFRSFGKGRHPAGLNFGDCFAYALAKVRGEPLLFKGDDFAQTDLQRA